MSRLFLILCLALSAFVVSATSSFADVPKVLTYQGYLTDASGMPLVGSTNLSFRLYKEESGGTALWTEDFSVAIQGGHFTVVLGAKTPMGLSLFTSNKQLYLGIKVEQDPEMTPRSALTSVPFARLAENLNPGANIDARSIIVNGKTVINDKGEWKGTTTGLKGDKGDKGDPGLIKSFQCPYGTSLQGVDSKGSPICATSNSARTPFVKSPTHTAGPSGLPTTTQIFGVHAYSDTSAALVYRDYSLYTLIIYVTTNSGQSWTKTATITKTTVGTTTRVDPVKMASGEAGSFLILWRDSTAKRSGVIQVSSAGRTVSNRVSFGDAGSGSSLNCSENKVCVAYHTYYTSPNYYSRVFSSTNSGSTWRQTYPSSRTYLARMRELYWSGTHFGFVAYTRNSTTNKTTYNYFRGLNASASSWTRTLSVPDGSISMRAAQGNLLHLNTTLRHKSSNAGQSWTQGYPTLFSFPSAHSSDCMVRETGKEIFCGSSCGGRLDPQLTLPYTCHGMPSGVSSFPRTTLSPSRKTVFWYDGSYFYKFTR